MHKLLCCTLAILLVIGCGLGTVAAQDRTGPVPGRYIVKLTPQADPTRLSQALGRESELAPVHRGAGQSGLIGASDLARTYVLTTTSLALGTADIATTLGKENVEWVEPDYYLEFFAYPQDSLFANQWYLLNEGQYYLGIERVYGYNNDELVYKFGIAESDVRITGMYDSPPVESTGVVVAIIDSGVDIEHPELAGRIYRNPGEIGYNNIDDDHNGFVDDTVGYDISGDSINIFNPVGDNDPGDYFGHGTHCAGIVAANSNLDGIAGIAPMAQILPVKIFPNGISSIGAAGIVYAVNAGARIINLSWGSPFVSEVLRESINYARRNGVLVCIASGNSGDNTRYYPGAFDLDSTVVVGASNSQGFMTDFSTYGEPIDIIAPGLDILSLRAAGTDMYADPQSLEGEVRIIADKYYLSDGTSMAAPMVAGAAALLWSARPDLDLNELLTILYQGATDLIDPLDRGEVLVGYDTLSGWGSLNIDASYGLLQNGGLFLAEPVHRSRITGDVVVKAGAIAGYTGAWRLEYAPGLIPTDWQQLATGQSLPADSIIFIFDDATIDGFVNFRLLDDYGRSSIVTVTYVRRNALEITSPEPGAEVEFNIPVIGSAYGPDFDSVAVFYRYENDPLVPLMTSTAEYFDSLLIDWSVSGADTGDFTIHVYGYFSTGTVVDSVPVRITSTFALGWPRSLPGRGGMTAITCDLNRDGVKEIAVGTSAGLLLFRADSGLVVDGFPALTGEDVRCVPAVYDLDGDGMDEIIVTGESGIHAFNYDGSYVIGWPQLCNTGLIPYEYAYPTPVITHLRTGSEPGAVPDSAVMIINKLGQLVAYRFNGDRYFYSRELFGQFDARISFSVGLGGGTFPFVTSADVNGDGRMEVVASYTSPSPYTGLGMFDGANGEPAFDMEFPTIVHIPTVTGSALADFDLDGLPEVLTTGIDYDGKQRIWIKTHGQTDFASWPIPIPETWNGWLASYPILADLDLDEIPEILITFFEYDRTELFIYRADGTPYVNREGRPEGEALYVEGVTFGTPAVANLLGDQYPEIIMRAGHLLPGTGPEWVYILDHTADPTPGWPKKTPARDYSVASARYAPLVDDIDNDDKVELVLISDASNVLVWDFEGAYDDGRNSFRFHYDDINSGIMTPSRIPTSVGGDSPLVVPGEIALGQNYPNPFNPGTTISFSLPTRSDVKIEVFNVLGQKVSTIIDDQLEAGDHRVEFDGDGLANGVYLYRLTAGDAKISRKMLLLK